MVQQVLHSMWSLGSESIETEWQSLFPCHLLLDSDNSSTMRRHTVTWNAVFVCFMVVNNEGRRDFSPLLCLGSLTQIKTICRLQIRWQEFHGLAATVLQPVWQSGRKYSNIYTYPHQVCAFKYQQHLHPALINKKWLHTKGAYCFITVSLAW